MMRRNNPALAALRHHVSGAIERGEAQPVVAQEATTTLHERTRIGFVTRGAIVSRPRHSHLALAFRAGRASQPGRENPYADRDGQMPSVGASVQCAQWHAWEAGQLRAAGRISDAGTMLRNARFFLRRATALGRT